MKKLKTQFNRILSLMLALILSITTVLSGFPATSTATGTMTIYFVDATDEGWIANDSAVIELVDNTQGHDKYDMTKSGDRTWSVTVPATAYNLTFNRYDSTKNTLWNSWSAGGRDGKVTYEALSDTHGAWTGEVKDTDDGSVFKEGDVIYLDVSSFPEWENDDALFYVNGTDATQKETNHLYSYKVTKKDEDAGIKSIRFWRGDSANLWNHSICISADHYNEGKNCITVTGWDDSGSLTYITLDNEEEEPLMLLDGEIDEDSNSLELYIDSVYESYSCNIYLVENQGEPSLEASTDDMLYCIDLSQRSSSFSCYATQDTDVGKLTSNTLNIVYHNGKFEIDNTDTDGDGLPDDFENFINTDPNNADTDHDGLTDGFEYYDLGTDPVNADTNKNGINDGDEDTDSDQLTNIEEMQNGTDPYKEDTDGDGLTDYEEIHIYGTDPLECDTDWDYMNDGDEISFGQDPLIADTDNNGIEDGYELYSVKMDSGQIENDGIVIPSLEINMEGCYIDSLFVTQIDGTDPYINDTIPGYIGSAYDFNVSEQIRDHVDATITYQFDDKLLQDKDFVPAIYYFNEDTLKLEKVENQHTQDNCVVAEVTHFSIYVLLNSVPFDTVWDMNLGSSNAIELVLDGSGSMSLNDPGFIRYSCADSLIDKMGSNDQVAVIGFHSCASVLQAFTQDKESAKKAVRNTFTQGGTDICDAIKTGIRAFTEVDDSTTKCMVLLTDGDSCTYEVDSLLADAKEKQIKIYTIGLGSAVNETFLKKISDTTGGEYYFASVAEDLPDIFEEFQTVSVIPGAGGWRAKSALAKAVFAAGFRYNNTKDIITSRKNSHQKDYGFTYAYDNACTYMDMNIHCEPIYFFYDGKEYMVEFWKGQYGAETGGEIGIYYRTVKTKKPAEYITGKWYESNVSDLWKMEFTLTQTTLASKEIISQSGKHWWLTGFQWGNYASSPDELKMTACINFKDSKMKDAFINGHGSSAKDKANYTNGCKKPNLTNYDNSDDGKYGLIERGYRIGTGYSVNGNKVTIYFTNPKCTQPKRMVKRRSKVRLHTKYSTMSYRILRCICNQTSAKKAHPNDPNNFDIGACKKLKESDVKKILTSLYAEGSDVYNCFISYMEKKDRDLAEKIKKSVSAGKWSNLSDKDFNKISKCICNYYSKAYKTMEDAPAKAVDKVMKTAGKVVKGVYK